MYLRIVQKICVMQVKQGAIIHIFKSFNVRFPCITLFFLIAKNYDSTTSSQFRLQVPLSSRKHNFHPAWLQGFAMPTHNLWVVLLAYGGIGYRDLTSF